MNNMLITDRQEGAIATVQAIRHKIHICELEKMEEYDKGIALIQFRIDEDFENANLNLKNTENIYNSSHYIEDEDGDYDEFLRHNQELFSDISHKNNEKIEKWLDQYDAAPSGYARLNYR